MGASRAESRDLRQLTEDHLERALAEDDRREVRYHIRSALQAPAIEDEERVRREDGA